MTVQLNRHKMLLNLHYNKKYGIIVSDNANCNIAVNLVFTAMANHPVEKFLEVIQMKQVIYNGGTMSYYGCSDPSILTVGKVYNVVNARDRGWQTDYTLEGVEGEFNSVWFDDVLPTHFAIGTTVPVEGKRYECCKLDVEVVNRSKVKTSTVQSVSVIGENTYKVTTRNSVYVVPRVK